MNFDVVTMTLAGEIDITVLSTDHLAVGVLVVFRYYHRGVDYGAYEGDAVRAPANGQVVLVGKEKDGFEIHGNCVGLDHGQGVTSILMHLNSSFVR